LIRYFNPGEYAWSKEIWTAAEQDLGVNFVLGAYDGKEMDLNGPDPERAKAELPPGAKNLGFMKPEKFMEVLAESRILVGVGNPLMLVLFLICFHGCGPKS
jgi:hypothetical protein